MEGDGLARMPVLRRAEVCSGTGIRFARHKAMVCRLPFVRVRGPECDRQKGSGKSVEYPDR